MSSFAGTIVDVLSNPLMRIALGLDYEYPLIHALYFTLSLNGTSQMTSVQAGYPLKWYALREV